MYLNCFILKIKTKKVLVYKGYHKKENVKVKIWVSTLHRYTFNTLKNMLFIKDNDGFIFSLIFNSTALTEPQAVYSCFTSGYQHKFTYFIRTIQGIEEYLQPIEETIRHYLIPSITGCHICTDNERDLLSLPPRYGGLGLNMITQTAVFEHQNSVKMTQNLKKIILNERKNETDNEIRKNRKKRKITN